MEPATKPATVAPATGVHAGPPPGVDNGVLNGTATAPQTATAPKTEPTVRKIVLRVLTITADLRITVGLFALAMLIVFWGTLAQQDYGVWTVVKTYFRSWFLFVPLRVVLFTQISDNGMSIPFFGGWTIGLAMLINLLAAHAVRFKLSWSRGGIILIHAGIIVMMVGEFVTGTFAIEGSLQVKEGRSVNYVTHPGASEFAVIRNIDPAKDEVVTVPRKFLNEGAVIDDSRLPFVVEVTRYMINSDVRMAKPGDVAADAKGHARIYVAVEVPEVSGVNPKQTHDAPSMYVNLIDRNGKKLGKWLFSALLENQWIPVEDKNGKVTTYNVNLRFKQTPRDFTIHLDKFTHDTFPQTGIVKDFHSYIRLTDPEAGIIDKKEEIYMNAPLTYKGETFYQQGWTTDPMTRKIDGTILQVVHNPGWALPYVSCFVVGLGMLYHFGITLHKFVNRRVIR
jgi:ResB-like family